MSLIHLNICNINSKIELSCNHHFTRILINRYQNFLGSVNKRPIDFSLFLKTTLSQTNNLSARDTVILSARKGWSIKGSGFHCRISNKSNYFSGEGISREDIYAFDSLLRVLWSQLLLVKNSFLVHSCGICNGSESYLFPGSSGSGKSTLAQKAPRNTVLSDELVGLQVKTRKSLLMGTPFWGEFQQGGLPTNQPLHSIYFLERGKSLRLTKISPQIAMKNLLKCILFFSNDPTNIKKLLKLVRQCVSNTPSYKIYLPKNTDYQDIIKAIDKLKG